MGNTIFNKNPNYKLQIDTDKGTFYANQLSPVVLPVDTTEITSMRYYSDNPIDINTNIALSKKWSDINLKCFVFNNVITKSKEYPTQYFAIRDNPNFESYKILIPLLGNTQTTLLRSIQLPYPNPPKIYEVYPYEYALCQ